MSVSCQFHFNFQVKMDLINENPPDDADSYRLTLFRQLLIEEEQVLKAEGARNTKLMQQLGLQIEMLSDTDRFRDLDSSPEGVRQRELEELERKIRKKYYVYSLQIGASYFKHLSDQLKKDIEAAKLYLEQAESTVEDVFKVSEIDLGQMQGKLKYYEDQLLKLKEKFADHNDPELHLNYIEKEIARLSKLKEENCKLDKELGRYQGLKPDLEEATEQLAQLRIKNQELIKLLTK